MKKLKFGLFLSICFLATIGSITYGLSYPIKQVNLGTCDNWENCWIDLPIIEGANYDEYEDNELYRSIYTVLWGASYNDGWDRGMGSHLGVDIATMEGTPVYAMLSGEVIIAGEDGNWGNIVTIKHNRNGETIYSTYAHLSNVLVEKGDIIDEGKIIGLVGTTGNSTGPHLHRQIENDLTDDHPYFPNDCGTSIEEITNSAKCRSEAYKYTVDPISFLEKYGTSSSGYYNLINTIEPLILDSYSDEDDLSLNIQQGNISLGEYTSIINITSNDDKETSILESPIKLEYDSDMLSLNTNYFYTIDHSKTIEAKGLQEGFTNIKIYYGDDLIKTLYFIILSDDKISILNKFGGMDKILEKLNSIT